MRFTAGQEDAREDVAKAIDRMSEVPLEVMAECARAYADRAECPKHVCGACGLRDPEDECALEVDLPSLPPKHWLRVLAQALRVAALASKA